MPTHCSRCACSFVGREITCFATPYPQVTPTPQVDKNLVVEGHRLGTMSVPQLKELCSTLRQSTSGTRAQLVQRVRCSPSSSFSPSPLLLLLVLSSSTSPSPHPTPPHPATHLLLLCSSSILSSSSPSSSSSSSSFILVLSLPRRRPSLGHSEAPTKPKGPSTVRGSAPERQGLGTPASAPCGCNSRRGA